MGFKRDIFPVFMVIIFLILARQIYPYAGVMDPRIVEEYRGQFQIETLTNGLGGPTCLEFWNETHLLVCDRDGGRILILDADYNSEIWLDGLNYPHGLLIHENQLFISEKGSLDRWDMNGLELSNHTVLIEGIKPGNHQTNAINILPNGTLIWHSGSTCNNCVEDDNRNGALLWVNSSSGEHGIIASGVRNSFHGVWVEEIGYLFTDNGQDTLGGDFPNEEVNLLVEGADYGWLLESKEDPNPEGTEAPLAIWTPHSSLNALALRPPNSELPGGEYTVYGTVFGSWATVLPQGHQIVKIDFTQSDDGWQGVATVFAEQVGTPLPITFGPEGDLYYATFDNGGALHKITAIPTIF